MSTAVAEPIAQIRPQPGPQEEFLASTADIVIYGGSAGGGKTIALLLEPLRHMNNKDFGAVIFRRTYKQIESEGGLWDEAEDLYLPQGATAREAALQFRFPSGMRVQFAHMQHAKTAQGWKGAQVPLLCFDQLEEFEESQFWNLLSRNRSAKAGIRPYVRATVNPVPADDKIGGWLHALIAWWIDKDTGYPIQERSGKIRWFVRLVEQLYFADSKERIEKEIRENFPDLREPLEPKSITFIRSVLSDNKILEERDPGYRATLLALPQVERERLLYGNWKIKESAGTLIDRGWFETVLHALPEDVTRLVRYWDKAGTEGGGAFSAGALVGVRPSGRYILLDIVRGQWSARIREERILQTAEFDRAKFGQKVVTWVEQEPGSGGKESAQNTVINLAGHAVYTDRVTGDKVTRSRPFRVQAEARNVDRLEDNVLRPGTKEPWNEAFLVEAHNFDGEHGYMDQVDAVSGAFNKLALGPGPVKQVPVSWG